MTKTAMRAAFEAAKVNPKALQQVAKQVLRVMRRQDARRAVARGRSKRK